MDAVDAAAAAGGTDALRRCAAPSSSTQLGTTLMHEHIFILDPQALQNYGHVWGPSYWDEEERVADAIAEARGAPATAGSRRSSTRPCSASAATSRASSA